MIMEDEIYLENLELEFCSVMINMNRQAYGDESTSEVQIKEWFNLTVQKFPHF